MVDIRKAVSGSSSDQSDETPLAKSKAAREENESVEDHDQP